MCVLGSKEIREIAWTNRAIDITGMSFAEIKSFVERHDLECVGYAVAEFGIAAALLEDIYTGILYAITTRALPLQYCELTGMFA